MSTDPLAEALARAYYEPLGWDMDDLDPDDLRDCLRAMEPVADAARAHAAAHDAQVRADERQKVAALLADEGTVETVARHLLPYLAYFDDDFPHDAARAALTRFGRLTGLIEATDA
jgi:hypothetical protein